MSYTATLIPGDGTGPELTEATRRVLEATGVDFQWDVQPAGADVMHEHDGNPLPEATLDSIRRNGVALKGPADSMLVSLGHEASALGVARQYTGIADVFVLDRLDEALAPQIRELGLRTVVTDTIMAGDAGRARLAAEVLEAARTG